MLKLRKAYKVVGFHVIAIQQIVAMFEKKKQHVFEQNILVKCFTKKVSEKINHQF
jgi:hypothetical protein